MRRNSILCLLAMALLAACSKQDEQIRTASSNTPPPAIPPPPLTVTNLPSAPVEPPVVKPDDGKIEKGFAVKNAGNLFLTFPKEWKDSIGRLRERDKWFDSVTFVPRKPGEFELRVGVINVGDAKAEQADIKSILHDAGQAELAESVEKSLDIREFEGSQAKGYYFVVTDKNRTIAAPKPGEYLYLTQGYAKIGRLILTFRLVSSHLSPEQEQLLEMVKTARFVNK